MITDIIFSYKEKSVSFQSEKVDTCWAALKKDLTYGGVSYLQKKSEYESLVNYDHWMMTTCILVSYVISFGVVYLLIPLLNPTGKTIGMRIIKAERVDRNKLSTLRKKITLLLLIFKFFLVIFVTLFK